MENTTSLRSSSERRDFHDDLISELQQLDGIFRAHMLAYRVTGDASILQRANDDLLKLEAIVAKLPERNLWCTKALALRSMLDRERASPRTDNTTLSLQRQDMMVERAMLQIEEARGVASDTASLLVAHREQMVSVNERTLQVADEASFALASVHRIRGLMTRQNAVVAVAAAAILGAIACTAYILVQ